MGGDFFFFLDRYIEEDFYVITSPCESNRGGRVSSTMRHFVEVIDDLGLRDLPLQGGPFTWSGGLNGHVMSIQDRFLVSGDWECYFNRVIQCTLPKPVPDHFPILLDGGGIRSSPSPFWFKTMWLRPKGFKEQLRGWWQGLCFKGSYSLILADKLKALRGILKVWNMEVLAMWGQRRWRPYVG